MSTDAEAVARFSWLDDDGRTVSVEDLPAAARTDLADLVAAIEATPDPAARRRALLEAIDGSSPAHVRMTARYLLWRQLWAEIWPLAFSDTPAPDLTMRNPGGMQ